MSSDRAIRRDEGERLARVSIWFTAVHPELEWSTLLLTVVFLPFMSSGVFSSFHGDQRQDRSQCRAGLHCCGKVRNFIQLWFLSDICCFLQRISDINDWFHPLKKTTLKGLECNKKYWCKNCYYLHTYSYWWCNNAKVNSCNNTLLFIKTSSIMSFIIVNLSSHLIK